MTERRPISTLLGDISTGMQDLVHQEIELAKAELRDSGRNAGIGGALFLGAGAIVVFALLFLSLGAWWGLGLLVGNGWSGLILGVFWLIVAGVSVLIGVKRFKKVRGAPKTVESVRGVVSAITPNRSER
ncbi:phage holin family protein [Pseudoclavibacter sp. 13-3]|uniref:phage holin family protein n=1 Tax=Pseudoclavibacter sp. 13-3 TaxID=2901228 RepID=UPI001E479A8E|nr:phage holin family protein [Pseudoclavibacter sp. 13-3]MCD7101698.1 phage holin family protein [Pseudoclavibacter sp. 13-3]